MTPSTDSVALTGHDAHRTALALAAVEGISTAALANLPSGALAAARIVSTSLSRASELVGFNDHSEVDGGDAVDVLGQLWESVQLGASLTMPSTGEESGYRVGQRPEGFRAMDTAPRDGRILRLLVRFDEHATDDASEAWTIGCNSCDETGDDEWQLAGWCWDHDHFTAGKGTPIGWLPILSDAVLIADDIHAQGMSDEAIALLREYAGEFTEEPEFADSLQGRVDAFLAGLPSREVEAATSHADTPLPDQRERLEEERWRLMNSFGHGSVADGRTRDRIAEIDQELAADAEAPGSAPPATVAAIEFALQAEEGLAFLRNWNEGSFDVCRKEWPEAPATCYVGADPTYPIAASRT